MKTIFLILSLVLFKVAVIAQEDTTIVQPVIDSLTVKYDTLPNTTLPQDTLPAPKPLYNKYGDLLNDDPFYNKKS